MGRLRFDRTTQHVPVKNTSTNPDDAVAVLHDVDLAIAAPVPQGPRADAEDCGGFHDGEEFICRHTFVLNTIELVTRRTPPQRGVRPPCVLRRKRCSLLRESPPLR